MFIINIQKFVFNSDDSYYENGYKNGISKLFFTSEKLLQYLNKQNMYTAESDSSFLNKIDIYTDTKLQSFLNTNDYNSNKEFILYIIDPDYLIEENMDETSFINQLHDNNFYETFDYKSKTCEVGLSQKHILRIICKKVIEGDDIYFSETEQYEPENMCIPKSVENIYNKELTSVQFIFRKGYEMDDLYYYWNLYNKQVDLKIPICNSTSLSALKKVHIVEIAFYILKQSLTDTDKDEIRDLSLIIECISNKKNSTIQLNTFFKNYTLKDAISNCCTIQEQKEIKLNTK
jgi:hypothetical protein